MYSTKLPTDAFKLINLISSFDITIKLGRVNVAANLDIVDKLYPQNMADSTLYCNDRDLLKASFFSLITVIEHDSEAVKLWSSCLLNEDGLPVSAMKSPNPAKLLDGYCDLFAEVWGSEVEMPYIEDGLINKALEKRFIEKPTLSDWLALKIHEREKIKQYNNEGLEGLDG